MSRAIESYELAYTTGEASQIPDLIRAAFAPEAVLESRYLDAPIRGHDALVEHIGVTRQRMQGVTSRRTSPLERVGDTIRWTWAFEADGQVVAEGMDFVVLDASDHIERLVVFDGLVPQDRT